MRIAFARWGLSLLLAGLLPVAPLAARTFNDLDGHGKSALLLQHPDGQILAGRLADGRMQFTPLIKLSVAASPVGVADFDGDGLADLLTITYALHSDFADVAVTRDFAPADRTSLRAIKNTWDVATVADFDGDGIDDVLWRYQAPGEVDTGVSYIWFSRGDRRGVGQVRKRGGAPLDWDLVGAADLNGDGAADIVYLSPDGQLRVLMATQNRSCANLSAGRLFEPASAPVRLLKLGDFSGNGRGDILVVDYPTGEVHLHMLDARNAALPAPAGNPDDPNAACTRGDAVIAHSVERLGWLAPGVLYGVGDFDGDGVSDVLWRQPDGTLTMWRFTTATIEGATVHGVIASDVGTAPANFWIFQR